MAAGKLRKKAKSLDSLIRSKVSWWPTYKQTSKAASAVKKHTNSNFSASKTIGETIEKIGHAPRNLRLLKKD